MITFHVVDLLFFHVLRSNFNHIYRRLGWGGSVWSQFQIMRPENVGALNFQELAHRQACRISRGTALPVRDFPWSRLRGMVNYAGVGNMDIFISGSLPEVADYLCYIRYCYVLRRESGKCFATSSTFNSSRISIQLEYT